MGRLGSLGCCAGPIWSSSTCSDACPGRRVGSRWVGLDERLDEVALPEFRARRVRSLLEAVFAPYDRDERELVLREREVDEHAAQ